MYWQLEKQNSVCSLLSISLFFFQLFDHVGEAKVILRNTGKVRFKFSIQRTQKEEEEEEADEETGGQKKDEQLEEDTEQNEEGQEVRPGQPMVIPSMVSSSLDHFRHGREGHVYVDFFFFVTSFCVCQGYVDAKAEQCLRVLYLPGVPEVFEKRLQLEVAHLPPQDIMLTGEGVFPRISLNLPQNLCMHTVIHTDMIVSLHKAEDENLL